MDVKNVPETKDTQQIIIQSNNYNVTVIPLEFPRNRVYNSQNQEYIVDQYRKHDEYVQSEDVSSSQGALYSVSQRVPAVSNSFSSLCGKDGAYCADNKQFQGIQNEWDRERERTLNNKETSNASAEAINDKPTDETSTAQLSKAVVPSTSNNSTKDILLGPVIPTCVYLHNHVAIIMEIEETPTATCDIICQAIINCEDLGINKQMASHLFTLWMTSPLLELQLKPSQKPYVLKQHWRTFIEKYSHASYNRQLRDEPMIKFQKNIFYPLNLEEKIKDQKILELLYEEARYNILEGRYPCEVAHYIMLGGIQARVELGPYNPQAHSTHYFREEQAKYLPKHVRKSATWTWLPISSKNSGGGQVAGAVQKDSDVGDQ
ncbi:unnamed protein product [Brassicogethes aeneus]|uniref:FERM domain-containing protein 8 n=1 Tax=Brassicogethes aeneus TaxID=1431903 RepID=A0A9P0AZK0_BRAAE|nr:unnamed protein product [Brassicogethes aeneus]